MPSKAYGVINITIDKRDETRTVQGGIKRRDLFVDFYLETGELINRFRFIELDARELVSKRGNSDG